MADWTLPSKETIEYGRSAIQQVIDLMRRWEQECRDKGEDDKAERHRWTAWIIEWKLTGRGEGCVIVPFDARYLDDEWRDWYSQSVLISEARSRDLAAG